MKGHPIRCSKPTIQQYDLPSGAFITLILPQRKKKTEPQPPQKKPEKGQPARRQPGWGSGSALDSP